MFYISMFKVQMKETRKWNDLKRTLFFVGLQHSWNQLGVIFICSFYIYDEAQTSGV